VRPTLGIERGGRRVDEVRKEGEAVVLLGCRDGEGRLAVGWLGVEREGRGNSGVQEGGAGKGRCGGETLAADSCFAVLAPRYPGNYTIDRPEAGDNLLHTYVSLPSDCFQGSVLYNR
jgi:hypothetical protein